MRPEDCAHPNRGPAPGLDEICPDCHLAAPELPPPGESGRLVEGPDFEAEAIHLLVLLGMQPSDHRNGLVAELLKDAYERGLRHGLPDFQNPVIGALDGARELVTAWDTSYGAAQLEIFSAGGWTLALSTGGWSDNEQALADFRTANPVWWMAWWESSRRGGSHTFTGR